MDPDETAGNPGWSLSYALLSAPDPKAITVFPPGDEPETIPRASQGNAACSVPHGVKGFSLGINTTVASYSRKLLSTPTVSPLTHHSCKPAAPTIGKDTSPTYTTAEREGALSIRQAHPGAAPPTPSALQNPKPPRASIPCGAGLFLCCSRRQLSGSIAVRPSGGGIPRDSWLPQSPTLDDSIARVPEQQGGL